MKAISVRQPWAWAIIFGGKDIENRDWPTNFRGRVAIHASKGMTKRGYREAADAIYDIRRKLCEREDLLDYGAIIGTVELVGCVGSSVSPWFCGEYGFVLANPVALHEPIPCKGSLGFWEVPQEIVAQMGRYQQRIN